ncbi:hypothetical protein Hanom_Chr03g00219341 [Helianthus anomalus]
MEEPASHTLGLRERPTVMVWWFDAGNDEELKTTLVGGSRVPTSVPVILIGRSRNRMGDLNVILNNFNLKDLKLCRS